MSKKEDNTGIVYVLINPVMPGLVKIGMTERSEIDARLKELYTTGVPVPFECAYACKVNQKECAKIEKALHKAFAPNRVNANREFFRISPDQAIAILELFHHEDVTEEISEEIQNDLTEDDKAASKKAKKNRPALNFSEMGIPEGATLEYVHDPNITCIVTSDRKVQYNGEIKSLSALSQDLLGYKHAPAPCTHWQYKGKKLTDIYDETYPFEES